MNEIDKRIRQIGFDVAKQHEEANRQKKALRESLLVEAHSTYNAVNNEIRNSNVSRAISVNYCTDCPCVNVWRVDRKPHAKIAEFKFSKRDGYAYISEGQDSKIIDRSSPQWAVKIITEKIALSFVQKEIAIHPIIEWSLIVIIGILVILLIINSIDSIVNLLIAFVMVSIVGGSLAGLFSR